ncbi:hypothetical protein HW561_23430, partial [Rhodobacteraceae bacterium B1Z28]
YIIKGILFLLKLYKFISLVIIRNILIGIFDFEIYKNIIINKLDVYVLGFKILGEKNLIMFYIEKDLLSYNLVIKCIKFMLIFKYNGFIFFVYNFSGFDVYYLLKILIEYNEKNNNYFILKFYFRIGKIIKLKIGFKLFKINIIYIIFVDSYFLLNKSL